MLVCIFVVHIQYMGQHMRSGFLVHMSKTKRILGECLLISSLPGKALRTLVDIARLAERFNMRSQSRAL